MISARDIESADVLLPAQFYIRSRQPTPWQQLAAATLRQALADYAKSIKQPRWRREIRSWIADDDDHARSFVNLCGLPELDPSYLRSHLLAVFNRIDRGDALKVVRRSTPRRFGTRRVTAN
jgi:hypothetical protein